MTIEEEEEETEAEPEQEMDTYMDLHEDGYDSGLRFQQKYLFPVPDLPSDDDDEDGLTPPPPPAYTIAGTSGDSTPVPNPSCRLTWPGPDNYYCVSLLESTGLYHLRYCSLSQHNNPLIEAFIERWQPDTNNFHMPFEETTITLHDLHYIMHLRVSGQRPNVWMDKADAIYAGVRAFGVEPPVMEKWYGGGSRVDDSDMTYGDNSSFASKFRVRAYIAYLLGKRLFVDKSGSKVKADFFPLLEHIDMISEYSWGLATLAYLYRQSTIGHDYAS
ncbi:PREDICTED: serine/threonine-protein phosphatase 7 long form homolog [Erythranthe guttata]|uniref:serine/threonine-protein phosphatase 7 long form homolog n=1 Tax=Erythranthe guttata TaxID=4155 RepID=UPI00064DA6DA|nr:PREDICTED: serine/threonine-protein phosphatase 7 long form homolog [Erythranthe guttata]|eukprot:XP_012850965.1 PREDICTED: serine/threonine-protein phosphatase 7 long form homolog [Erythranthe guttata]